MRENSTEIEDLAKAQEIEKWMKEWIDTNADKPETLRNLALTMTGSCSVSKEILCDAQPINGFIYPHSCSNSMDVLLSITKEDLMNELTTLNLTWSDKITEEGLSRTFDLFLIENGGGKTWGFGSITMQMQSDASPLLKERAAVD